MVRGSNSSNNTRFFPNCNLTTQSIEYGVRSVNYRNTFVTIVNILNIHCKNMTCFPFK